GEGVLRTRRLTVTEPIEVPNLVGAVVGAIAGADATVVDLHVQSIRRVIRRVGRTDWFAGGVAAVLAHHRHEARIEIGAAVFPALVVALDTNPRHLATSQQIGAKACSIGQDLADLPVRANGRDVVLGVARADASSASGTPREIDGHRPATLGHAAPVIWLVHALVIGVRIAVFTLGVVRDRRAQSG